MVENGRWLISSKERSVTGKQEMSIVTYLRSKGKAFCSLRENPVDCFGALTAVDDETSSTDSERFLFTGAIEAVDRSFWGRAKSAPTVVIAECALLRVEPTLDLDALISYSYPTNAKLYATDPNLRCADNPPTIPKITQGHPTKRGQ